MEESKNKIVANLGKTSISTNDVDSFVRVVDTKNKITVTELQMKAGLLGKLLGSRPRNVTLNIAFILAFILLLLVLFCLKQFESIPEKYVELLFSALTLIIGYIFGRA